VRSGERENARTEEQQGIADERPREHTFRNAFDFWPDRLRSRGEIQTYRYRRIVTASGSPR
jgi:hypothetical protein